jgi:hypothetical protein
VVIFGTSKYGRLRWEEEKRRYSIYRENIVAFIGPRNAW